MEKTIKIRKGLDLNLAGEAQRQTRPEAPAKLYALVPDDFHGVKPRPVVKEGDKVEAGSPLFVAKHDERIRFVSPVSGTVSAIVRGERRKILSIQVIPDGQNASRSFTIPEGKALTAESLKALLLESGLFAYLRSRPYDVVASPDDQPKGIFISTFSKMPLAADFSYVLDGQEADFQRAVSALALLAPVYLGIAPEQVDRLGNTTDATVYCFDGPNPSGNVGVHINHVSPINKGETVWTLGAEEALFVGRLLRTGHVDLTRHIAVAGSDIRQPQYAEAKVGAQLASLVDGQIDATHHVRLINGNPLVGRKAAADDFLGAHVTEVCAIPEGDDRDEVLGWITPRLNDFSTNRSYFSWLQGKARRYTLDCRIKGSQRHMIMSGEYDRVFPMDIYAGYLVKAIITGNIDRQEELGIYEVAPEDFAVAEFVDSSKLELQRIVREGLDLLRKENS